MKLEEIKSRKELIQYFKLKRFKRGAEIGVLQGKFSQYILDTIPDISLLAIDPWSSPPYINSREIAYETLSHYENCKIIQQTSMAAACNVPDESLDFVYIDGDHSFDAVMCDLIVWAKKVKPGGIISGHDYVKWFRGLKRAVNVYTNFHKTKLYLTEPQRRGSDKYISFYFVKK